MKCVIVLLVLPILGSIGKSVPDDVEPFANSPRVQTASGGVIGSSASTSKGTRYEAFRGIPYAQPPVGNLRFASPVPVLAWSGFRDAREDANICIQGSDDTIQGSEDCLYLNVYRPANARNLAVMVWIHGGAFTSGDSRYESFAPDFLLDDDVVFVSFNYRLGIFGFLNTEDAVVPGNFGLKDQVLALRWVKDNIARFGGDPNRITIFGESAGGASVSYILQSPSAEGLFNAAIIQSGNSLNLWSLTTRARSVAFQVGYNLNIVALLSRTLLDRLRNINALDLQNSAASAANTQLALNPLRGLIWAPAIEREGPDAFFTQNSDEYLRSGQFPSKVPILIGFTSNEAGYAHYIPDSLLAYLLWFDVASTNLAPFSISTTTSVRSRVANLVRDKFFESGRLSEQLHSVVKFVNTDQFFRGALRFAENVLPYVPSVHFYVFGYEGDITGFDEFDGVGHAEELFYLFKQPGEYSENDLRMKDKLVRLWTNFAKTFNPTPQREALLDNLQWPRLTGSNIDYAWLNLTLSLDRNPDNTNYNFYKDLFNAQGSGQFTTF